MQLLALCLRARGDCTGRRDLAVRPLDARLAALSEQLDKIKQTVEGAAIGQTFCAHSPAEASAAIKLIRRVRMTGSWKPARLGGYRRPILEPHERLLRELVEAMSDITLSEIRAELSRRVGLSPDLSTFENPLLVLQRNAGSIVVHRDVEEAIRRAGHDLDRAVIRELNDVADKVKQHLGEAPLVRTSTRQAFLHLRREGEPFAIREQFSPGDRGLHDLADA